MNGVDAFAAVADRLDLFADEGRYERALACRDLPSSPASQQGIPNPFSLMKPCGSVGSRFTGDRVAVGRSQPPSHIASTGV